MKTFAFKNSQKYWSTRYSFTPRNYSRLDRDMFTSHPAGSDAIYIHGPKAAAEKNTYYGITTSSSIKLTFNNEPGQNKIYKNMSLEGSFGKKNIYGSFRANDSTISNQLRVSSINGWKEKGAHLYADIAKSPSSGRANVTPVGVLRRVHQVFFPEATADLGSMWTDTGKPQSEWLSPESIAEVLDGPGSGPKGLAAIMPYGLDRAYLSDQNLFDVDPTFNVRQQSRYLFFEIDFFPGYKDSSGRAKYILVAADADDASDLYGTSYDAIDAPYLSDLGLCFYAKNKATGNFKKRKYTEGVGFSFDPYTTASVDGTATKEGLFVYAQGSTQTDGGGGGPETNEFECGSTSITIADGIVGEPVIVTSTVGTIQNTIPSEYVSGQASYTVNVTAPNGFDNAGTVIACTAQGFASVDNGGGGESLGEFTCITAGVQIADGTVGGQLLITTNAGSVVGSNPDVYLSGQNVYTVTVEIPEGYDNYPGTVTCANISAFGSEPNVGDLDGDGAVTTQDLLTFLSFFGLQDAPIGTLADLDGDGSVATSDLLTLLGVFGTVYNNRPSGRSSNSQIDIPNHVGGLNVAVSLGTPILIYAVTPEDINGEAARGNYVDVSLTFPGVNFELDVVNLDYEPTQLDHSR